jgi:hypothetical protein
MLLVPRLKKEYSYTSTLPTCLHGRLQGQFKLYIHVVYIVGRGDGRFARSQIEVQNVSSMKME